MPDDLVAGLLSAIEQREKAARQAPFDPHKIHVDQPEDGPHIRFHDPDSVLRLCRAHRNIVDMYQQAKATPVKRDKGKLRGLDHASAMGRMTTLGLVLQALAEGYGLREENSDE